MKSSTRLDSVVFQLTPTRTRCDLLVTANGKTEKVATGLLVPFLAHLKTAQDQVDKGGYSIILKPDVSDNAAWFTKGTIERFVRFVSNPEVLERVYTLETEIIQMKEAIGIHNNSDTVLNVVDDDLRSKRAESMEGSRSLPQFNEEKAIVLYEPDGHPKQANRSTTSDEDSKAQVLKVLETRKTMLQKEQGMAFARAKAAGFDVDDMVPLISFAKTFGASRLMDACSRFMDLWKRKHETGQWVEIESAEVMTAHSNISATNDSGIMFANAANMRRNSWPGTPENSDVKSPTDNKPNINQEYVQGQQHPQPMYAPWPVHSPPGTFPVFQGYTMQGMAYYPPGYQGASPYPSTDENRRSSSRRKAQKHHSSSSEDSDSEDEDREKEKSSRRKKSGKVVIRNINYINSKKKDQSGTESDANESHEEEERRECHSGKEITTKGSEADTGDWQAFQSYLLQDADRDERTIDHHMMGKEMAGKKRQGAGKYDPLAYDERESERYQERDQTDIRNGSVTRRTRGSSDSFMVHQRENGFENSSDPLDLNGFDHPRNGVDKRSSLMDDDSYIVTRGSEAGSNKRSAIDMGSEISSRNQTDGKERKQVNYEPHDLSLLQERETEKLSAGYDPALDFGSNALKKKNGAKKLVKDPKSRLSNDSADKRKASGPIRKGRATKMSPLDEARARADKLRSFKADLMKMKKEKEEEQRKRIEALKIERQKRIASKSNPAAGRSQQVSATQTRKPTVNKFSPGALRSSKFSDSEPVSLSPLQRIPRRSASLGSNDFQKFPKNGKLSTESKSTGNRLTRSISATSKRESVATGNKLARSISPLPPPKRESISTRKKLTKSISPLPLSKRESRVSLDTQNKPVTKTRRLSEPKMGSNSAPSSSVMSRRTIASKKVSDAPEIKKLSAIVNYDIAKIASLPELKIKPTNGRGKGIEKTKTSASEVGNNNKSVCQNDVDETPEVEKTVVMVLPSSARSISTDEKKQEKESIETMHENGNDLVLVRLETLSDLVTETPKFLTSHSVVEKPYEAPYARVSSLEGPCTVYSEYPQPSAPSLLSNETQMETVKVLVPEKRSEEASEKSQTKESASKGFRKLLNFGKKNSSTGEHQNESSNAALNSNEDHEPAATSEASTLKSLISQDETPTVAASQKSSRHFSLLSPFKNKKMAS